MICGVKYHIQEYGTPLMFSCFVVFSSVWNPLNDVLPSSLFPCVWYPLNAFLPCCVLRTEVWSTIPCRQYPYKCASQMICDVKYHIQEYGTPLMCSCFVVFSSVWNPLNAVLSCCVLRTQNGVNRVGSIQINVRYKWSMTAISFAYFKAYGTPLMFSCFVVCFQACGIPLMVSCFVVFPSVWNPLNAVLLCCVLRNQMGWTL
jgi:hypothetical protein